jgi:tetratricopeptide (TPR) repeat protein
MVLLRKTLYGVFAALLLVLPIQAKKTQPAALSAEQEQQFKYYWYAARQAIDEERYTDAYTLLEFCHWINPQDGTTLYQLGVIHHGLGHPEQAKECFEQAYALQPKGTANENLLEQLKRIYLANSEWQKALDMQDEIDKRTEYDALSALTRYRIYAMWGKPKKAIAEIDRYLENDPANVQFLLFRLEIMERIGSKREEMIAMYDKILSLDPYNVSVLNNYAYYLATHGGNLKEAERMSALTIGAEPDNPVFLDTYGWIMHLQGQNELALFYLKKALNNTDERSRAEIERHIKEAER